MSNDGNKEVTGVILFFCAIIFALMFYLPDSITGAVGHFFRSVGFGAFGSVAFIIPAFLLYASIDFFVEKREGVSPLRVTSAVLLMMCASSLLAAITMDFEYFKSLSVDAEKAVPTATKAISLLWKSGLDGKMITPVESSMNAIPGGVIGGMIAVGIESVCGKIITIMAIIAFTVTQVLLIFHISVKKTASMIGNATMNTVGQMSRAVNNRNAARYRRSADPRYQRANRQYSMSRAPQQGYRPQQRPVNMNQPQSQPQYQQPQYESSPFVVHNNYVEREVPVIKPQEPVAYDAFDVNRTTPVLPRDENGFIDVDDLKEQGNFIPEEEANTLNYGERKVTVPDQVNAADFSFDSHPHNPPLMPEKKHEMFSFDPTDDGRQKDFYDLNGSAAPANDQFEQEIPVGTYEESVNEIAISHADDDDDELPVEIEGDDETPGVRKPKFDYFDYGNVDRQNNSATLLKNEPVTPVTSAVVEEPLPAEFIEPAAAPVVPEPAKEAKSEDKEETHEIAINAEENEKHFSMTEGRKFDIKEEKPMGPSVDIPSKPQPKYKGPYVPAPTKLLDPSEKVINPKNDAELTEKAHKLEEALANFGIQAKVVNITHGPTITRFEFTIAQGIKVSRVVGLSDDIQMAMAAISIRIEAPIPGKSTIGIEIPNDVPLPVKLRGLLETDEFKNSAPLNVAIGKNVPGKPMYCNLAKMPHLLIAGSTGSGKSVCLNTMLISILCKASPDEVRLLMVDPKVVELSIYNGIPHLIMPVVSEAKKAVNTLKWAVLEMERRYNLFAESAVRNLDGYNDYLKLNDEKPLPLILVIIDEFADLMIVASKEVEEQVLRLAAKARAAGIHLILATQRPSVDVITGVLKNNLPSRIALAVTSGVDSKTILNSTGAEKLLGKGDMLYAPSDAQKPIRGQGAFVSDAEVERVIDFLKKKYGPMYDEDIMNSINTQVEGSSDSGSGSSGGSENPEDDMFEKAVNIVIEQGMASVSILQRRLGLGYPRAARLIDEMEQKHIIGPFEGSKPRKVLISATDWLERKANRGE